MPVQVADFDIEIAVVVKSISRDWRGKRHDLCFDRLISWVVLYSPVLYNRMGIPILVERSCNNVKVGCINQVWP